LRIARLLLNYPSVPAPLRDLPWTRRSLYRGVSLFKEGDRADLIFLLDSGLVKLSHNVDSHRRTIIRLVRPGELVGDRTMSGTIYRFTAEVLSDGAAWEINRELFRQTCDAVPAVLSWVTGQVEKRLAEVEKRIELIMFARVEKRVLSLLADLAETTALTCSLAPESVQIPLSQSEIAQLIGATRETASTTLNQLERRGLLRLGRRQIELVSLPAVREALLGEDDRASSAHA
jgi:CRP/FNR family transcriptional regulator, cyclic AMP receptor protein